MADGNGSEDSQQVYVSIRTNKQTNKLDYILNYEHKIVEHTAVMRHNEFKATQFVINDKSVQMYCTGKFCSSEQ